MMRFHIGICNRSAAHNLKSSALSAMDGSGGFCFNFRVSYAEAVEKQLYDVDVYDLVVVEHTFQYKSATRLTCLQCCGRLPLPTNRDVLQAHLKTHTTLNAAAFDLYHRTFSALVDELQMHQIYFDPFDKETLHCEICACYVTPTDVEKHIVDVAHRQQLEKNSSDSFYWHLTAKQKKKKAQMATDEALSLFVEAFRHQSGTLVTCLCCQCTVHNVHEHLCTKRHVSRSGNPNLVAFVRQFNAKWEQTALNKHKHLKRFFVLSRNNAIQCLLCRRDVKSVERHVKKFPCNFLHATNPMYDDSFDWHGKRAKFVAQSCPSGEYSEEVRAKFYAPPHIFHKALVDDELKMYTLQRRNYDASATFGEIFCLICKCSVVQFSSNWNNPQLMKIVTEHLMSRAHTTGICSKKTITAFYVYHKFFLHAEKHIQQLHDQVNPRNRNFTCDNCRRHLKKAAIVEHLSGGGGGAKKCQGRVNRRRTKKPETHSERRVGRLDRAFEELYVNNATTSPPSNSEDDSESNTSSEDDDDEAEKTMEEYDDNTMLKLYSMCNTPNGCRRPPILSIQMRSEHERFCLACDATVSSNLREHLNGAKHNDAVQKTFARLQSYHAYWMARDGDAQLDQVYFNAGDIDGVRCAICGNRLPFDAIAAHACAERLKRCQISGRLSAVYRQMALGYDLAVMRRCFYGMHYDISRDWLHTDIPIAYRARAYFYCLMCADVKTSSSSRACVPQKGDMWKNHILKFHITPSPKRDGAMQRVQAYHAYWMQQPAEKQLYLINFMLHPKSLQSIICLRGHVVDLQHAVEHIDANCDLRDRFAHNQKDATVEHDVDAKPDEVVKKPPHDVCPLMDAINGRSAAGNLKIALPKHLQAEGKHLVLRANGHAWCKCCLMEIANDVWQLRHHLGHAEHEKTSKRKLNVQYYCDICDRSLPAGAEIHWLVHLRSEEHVLRLQKIGAERCNDVAEHLCRTCKTVLFGDSISLILHQANYGRTKKEKAGALTIGIKELLNTKRKVGERAKSLRRDSEAVALRTEPYVRKCIEALEEALRVTYPKCKVYEFGSRLTGFVTKDSDLDLFVDVEDNAYNAAEHNSRAQQKVVLAVKKLLAGKPKLFADLHSILSARVPILKVIHRATDIDCDLSFSNGLSVENTQLIRFFVDLEPMFFEAVLLLKEWGAQMHPPLKNEMTSYALIMMALFSMQIVGQMPSIEQLRQCSTSKIRNINGWDTLELSQLRYDELRALLTPPTHTADVVLAFFRCYADFNFEANVVCPLLGRAFKVALFANEGAGLPAAMRTYVAKVKNDPDAVFRTTCSMFVQDPFDLGHNVTKNINKQFLNNFRKLCGASFEHLNRKSSPAGR